MAASPQRAKPLRVGFVLTNSFTLSALSNLVDVLRLAADDGDLSRPIRCRWHIMSHNADAVRSSAGVAVLPTAPLLDPVELDYIVVVGGLLHKGAQIDEVTSRYLVRAGKSLVAMVGVCTGSFVLYRLGLLEGKKCCVSWYHYRDFIEEFDDFIPSADQLFVVDGRRITCSGGAGVQYLAAYLVDRHLDASSAQKALHILQVDRMRPGSTSQPAPPSAEAADDERISRALIVMEQNLARPATIATIASKLKMSPRQLERLFKEKFGSSPQVAYLQLRLKHARWMLRTDLNLASIAAETGFADGAHLSKAFKASFGVNPSDARRQLTLDEDVDRVAFLGKAHQQRVFN